jgi:hypothetical protein
MLDRENVDSAELNAWNVEFLQRITYLFGPQQGCWRQGHTEFMLERLQIERVVFVNGGPICIGGPGCITPGMRRLKTYVMEAGMYLLVESSVESNVLSLAGCHKSAYQTKLKGGFPIPPLAPYRHIRQAHAAGFVTFVVRQADASPREAAASQQSNGE